MKPVAPGLHPQRVGCVLDVETVLDPDVFALVRDKTRGGYGRRALHRVVCASILTFVERGAHGELAVMGLQTFHLGHLSEVELLAAVDTALPDATIDSTALVTYNGLAHDLIVLRQRAERLWLFNLDRLRGWDAAADRHVDLIYHYGHRSRSRPSLADVAALLGTGMRGSGCTSNVAASSRTGGWDGIVRRNQADVAATFLAYGHFRSWQRGCALAATSSWVSLSDWARGLSHRSSHFAEFSHNHLVRLARERMGAIRDGRERCSCPVVST